jgi:hypothetical protein
MNTPSGLWTDWGAFNLLIPNVPTSDDILGRVKKLKGIKKARIDFVQRRYEAYGLLGEAIERKVNRLQLGSKTGDRVPASPRMGHRI